MKIIENLWQVDGFYVNNARWGFETTSIVHQGYREIYGQEYSATSG